MLMGSNVKESLPSEQISRENARRSIVLSCNVEAGEILNDNKLTYKRPGTGVSPKDWDRVVGSKAVKALSRDHILEWSDIEIPQ